MKKLIVALVYAFERVFNINGIVTKTFREEKARRVHNANVIQHLLDAEHDLRDRVNEHQFIPSTTKNAILKANKYGFSRYNSYRALIEADFR